VLGKRATIADVAIVGPDSNEASRLLHSTRSLRARLTGGLLKSGKPYTAERIKAAEAIIRRTLSQQHRLASKVERNPPEYHAENNRVDVSFKVELGPVVSVRVSGAKLSILPFLSGRQMRKLIPIYSERSIDSDLVDEGQQNLVDYFQKKGYFHAQVKVDLKREPDQVSLVYEIERGKKGKVDRIVFHGNHEISSADLEAHVVVKKARLWNHGSVSQKTLKQSSENLQAIYRDKGYEDVKVTSRTVDHEPKIDVEFDIEEGPQTLVGEITSWGTTTCRKNSLPPQRVSNYARALPSLHGACPTIATACLPRI
jgi:outer membrane protein assembly factor BamA